MKPFSKIKQKICIKVLQSWEDLSNICTQQAQLPLMEENFSHIGQPGLHMASQLGLLNKALSQSENIN